MARLALQQQPKTKLHDHNNCSCEDTRRLVQKGRSIRGDSSSLFFFGDNLILNFWRVIAAVRRLADDRPCLHSHLSLPFYLARNFGVFWPCVIIGACNIHLTQYFIGSVVSVAVSELRN